MDPTNPLYDFPKKVVVIQLAGGPRDGHEFRSDEPTPTGTTEAHSFWIGINLGKGGLGKEVGKHFWVPGYDKDVRVKGKENMGPPEHRYRVINKNETETEIVYTCQHEGEDTGEKTTA